MSEPSTPNAPSKPWWPRLLVLALIAAAVTAFFALDWHRELTWDNLVAHRDELRKQVDENLAEAMAVYSAIYVAVAALSLPAASIVTLAGGALFDLVIGTLLVSFSSTLGATIAFLLTRYLFADFVQRRWPARFEAINRGIAIDGPFYLFTLRLVPLFPFWLVNLAMGVTGIRVWTFWWVSQLGMLPATIIYVYAGTQLGRISSPKDIASPGVLISLALLGIVPLALRKALQFWSPSRAENPPQPEKPS